MKTKLTDWRQFYKFPLTICEYDGNVVGQDNEKTGLTMAFDWLENTYIGEYPIGGRRGALLADSIVRFLNGETEYRPDFAWSKCIYDSTIVCINEEPCIMVRGWGALTGKGGYDLNADEAAKIQDDFVDYIIRRLNGEIESI